MKPIMQISDLIVNLIDANTNLVMRTLSDGAFVGPGLFDGSATIAVIAATGAPAIGSMRLTVGQFTGLESSSPYALPGGLLLDEGPQVLRLEVFDDSGGLGAVLGDFTIGFTVGIKSSGPEPVSDPTLGLGPEITPVAQAALDALWDWMTAVEASSRIRGSDISTALDRIAAVEAAGVATKTRVAAVERRLDAASAGLKQPT